MDRLISEQAVLDLIADYDLSMGQVVKGIHALPPANPQESVLDKIIAEIESYKLSEDELSDMDEDSVKWGMKIVYDIVDKHKTESEG